MWSNEKKGSQVNGVYSANIHDTGCENSMQPRVYILGCEMLFDARMHSRILVVKILKKISIPKHCNQVRFRLRNNWKYFLLLNSFAQK